MQMYFLIIFSTANVFFLKKGFIQNEYRKMLAICSFGLRRVERFLIQAVQFKNFKTASLRKETEDCK